MELSDGMSIETYASINAVNQIMQSVGTAVLDKSLETMEQQGAAITKMMEQSVHPNLGGSFDMSI
ncbi:MAG: YjfB family protein [Eubacterium sp.]|nr:YjfB family protein [Eubacterium sp.]